MNPSCSHRFSERRSLRSAGAATLLYFLAPAILTLLVSACQGEPSATTESLTAQANSLVQQNHRSAAIAVLMQALRADPDNASVRWRLAQLHYELGAFDFAESHLLRALALGTSPSSVMPLLAKTLLARDDFDKLFDLELPRATSSDARAEVLAQQALGLARLERFDQAQSRIQEALRLAPDSEAVGVGRARVLLERGERDQAEAAFRELIAVYPNSADALGGLADIVRDAGRLDEAEVLYGRALEYSASKVQLHFLRGEVRLDLAMIDGAEEDTVAVEAAVPNTFAAHYLRARLLLLDARHERAMASFEAANTLQPRHFGTLLYGGVAAYTLGRQELAEDWLLRVWREAPGNVTARMLLGAIRFSQRRYVEAEDFLQPLPKAVPKNRAAKRLLAASLVARNKAAEAVAVLADLVALTPDDPRSQLDLSVALILSGSDARGLGKLTGLLDAHPAYRPPYEYLIAYHVREGLWDEAERWADAYLRRYPGDMKALFLKGAMHQAAGQIAAATKAFEAILGSQPANAEANVELARLAVASGDFDAARGRYQAILSASPDNLPALLGEAQVAVLQQRVDDGIRLLKQAVAAHPRALQPRMELARLLLRDADRPSESAPNAEPDSEREAERGAQAAVAALEDKAPKVFRRDGDYLYLLADALRASGALQLAARQLRELIAMRPRSRQAYALYARVLTELDDKVALEAALTQMLSIDPSDQLARLELVRLHIATERFPTAERLLQPVLADPTRPPLADLLEGLILTATDRAIQAVPSLRRAYTRSPSQRGLMALANAEADAALLDTAVKRQQLWLEQHPDDIEVRVSLGGHLVRAGALDEAIAQYRQVVEMQPDHVVALNNLAWYQMDNDLPESLAFATRALELAPESLGVAHTLVTAQVAAEEWRDADLTLDRALSRYPTDSELLWLSARVLHHKGRRERAMEHLSRILERDPPEDERERATALLTRIEDEQRAEAAAKLY